MTRRLPLSLILLLALCSSAQAAEFTIDRDGFSAITLDGQTVASGSLRLTGEHLGKSTGYRIQGSTISHFYEFATARYTFRPSGDDLRVTATVFNVSSKPLDVLTFELPEFTWDATPTGIASSRNWNAAYLEHMGGIWHPSAQVLIGASYLRTEKHGFSIALKDAGTLRHLWWWEAGGKEYTSRKLTLLVEKAVQPKGRESIEFTIRAGKGCWKHLLEPYRDYFYARHGKKLLYEPDHRPITAYSHFNVENVSKENPYGYHDGPKFLDDPKGTKAYLDKLVPRLKRAGIQGQIFWAFGDYRKLFEGHYYPVDQRVMPKEIKANLANIAKGFTSRGVAWGSGERPSEVIEAKKLRPAKASERKAIRERFQPFLRLGATLFYLDSSGFDLEAAASIPELRKFVGPKVQLIPEICSDQVIPYAAVYSEMKDGKAYLYGDHTLEVYRWLYPTCGIFMKPQTDADIERIYARQFSPILQHYYFRDGDEWAEKIRALNDKHLSGKGWK